MEYGILFLAASVVAGGVLGAVIRAWSVSVALKSFEFRCSLLEGILQREVKTRAANTRWNKPDPQEELIAAALAVKENAKAVPWWQNPSLKKGGYTP